jgi:chitinase
VNENDLGGIMFWSIDNDDFRGSCHSRAYPLIEAGKEALLGYTSYYLITTILA